jgi:hypothetical protein
MDAPLLPQGANGLDLGDVVIEFRQETRKIIALHKASGDHYTMQAAPRSGIIDVHRTWRDQEGTARHQTIFAMHGHQLVPLLQELSWVFVEFLRLVRRLRVGWLHHRHITIVRGLEPTTHDEIAAVTSAHRKHKKRLVFDEERFTAQVTVPEFLDEIWEWLDGAFSLLHRNRKIGIAIRGTDRAGQVHLVWIKLRDLRRFVAQAEPRVIAAVGRYAIPKEEYGEYPELAA